ncbi:MAG TPA: metallophosphoesterase [Gemmatimonadaceae bacterium]|nr:metallophosphoesterase [Gemmatimonadaceae bacterium]
MLLSLISQRAALLAAGAVFISQPCRDNSAADNQSFAMSVTDDGESNADPVLVGAGDIASCGSSGDEETARLLDDIPGAVFTAGDNAYLSRRMRNPFPCYDASWGRHKSRTRPVLGNHEYEGGYTDAYFDYFGSAAGERGKGYYSYDLGSWHIIALNTMIDAAPSSPQGKWLSRDLSRNRRYCTLAYFHHPRFSSGPHHTSMRAIDLWTALARAGVDVVISGHDHIYERFAPMTVNGNVDDKAGMRQFVVGTGGVSHYSIKRIAPNSEVRNNTTFGVIRLVLHDRGYDWRFVPVRGGRFTDAGTGRCH